MTSIEYSKVDWSGLELPAGYQVDMESGKPIVIFSLSGGVVAKHNGSEWWLTCGVSQTGVVLTLITKIEEHAKRYLYKTAARTEIARGKVNNLLWSDSRYTEYSALFSPSYEIDAVALESMLDGENIGNLEIVINRIG